MIKTLRSLIHEQFPLDLRVKIELLSRRRDITNKEKQEEIFKLLREFQIEGIVPLGPGTNRYAFKLNGFVIKVATDHDGKIDNLKEFKMAKRLYPYVTKTYEVSKNGTLLVAEYIQPFASYTEMYQYADKIRDILTKLSSVYLIGDVGVTPKNYANWGLRVGSDDPVCLDFAYVYEVSSELFVCRECKNNSMLVPNNDFTELYCPAKGCGHKYRFEDIRRRIGNDLHNHEIGDLSEEGYVMRSSHVSTELSEQRSNYLSNQKKAEVKETSAEEETPIELDNFQLDQPPSFYIINDKEDLSMDKNVVRAAAVNLSSNAGFRGPVIQAVARRVNDPKPAVIPEAIRKPEMIEDSNDVAFAGPITDGGIPVIQAKAVIPASKVHVPSSSEVLQVPEETPVVTETKENVKPVANPVEEPVVPQEEVHSEAAAPIQPEKNSMPEESDTYKYSESFVINMQRAVSKVSNRISDEIYHRAVFDDVRYSVRDKKMFPEPFYKTVQNAVFRSLVAFCNFTQIEAPNANNKKTHREWVPPTDFEGAEYEPTLRFLERIWIVREINQIEDPAEMMEKYREMYTDYLGLQRSWLPVFVNRLMEKMNIDVNGANRVAAAIAEVWCAPEEPEPEDDNTDPDDPTPKDPEPTDDSEEWAEPTMADVSQEVKDQIAQEEEASVIPENVTEDDIHKILADAGRAEETSSALSETDDEDLIAFKGEYSNSDNGEEYGDDQENYSEGEYEGETRYLSVEIYPEDDIDIVRLKSGEAFGPVEIPFYVNLNSIDLSKPAPPSLVDNRNGVWDWLIHMVPDIIFRTADPEYWLELNDEECAEQQIHIVILDDEEDGNYLMGIYYVMGIYVIDDDGQYNTCFDYDMLDRLNRLICGEIGNGSVSHLRRSLTMEELIHDEDYVKSVLIESDEEGGEQMENENGFNDVEEAAIAALMEESDENAQSDDVQKADEETVPNEEADAEPVQQEEVVQQTPMTFKPIRRPSAVQAETYQPQQMNSAK